MSAQPLRLDRPRDLGGLINTTFSLYARHFALFAALAFGTVLVVDTIVLGVGAGWLWQGYDEYDEPAGIVAIELLLPLLVLTPLITATHAQAVVALGQGRDPTFVETLQAGLRVFGPVVIVVVIVTFGSFLGLLLLVVPGVYAWVAWFVAVQAVVVEDRRGIGALRRSHELVRGSWWRVLGISLVILLIASLASGILTFAAELLADATDSMAVYLAGYIVSDAILYSFTALAGTLLYFDLCARRSVPVATHERAAEG